jgi:hypothetical protein
LRGGGTASWRRLVLVLLLLFGPATLAQEQPLPFASLWVDDSGTVSARALQQTMQRVAEQEPQPRQIVLLIHGYDMGREESSRLYRALTEQVKERLSPDPVAVVGVQWSGVGGSFLNPAGAYFGKLSLARSIGRGPLRQLLLGLQDRYPNVPVTVLAHSMGCEITVAAVAPEIVYAENPPRLSTYEPQREIVLTMAAFVGSDLDYDIWYKSGDAALKWFDRCQLTWSTVSDPTARGDKVLSMRARVRGKAAGALFPRLTLGQLDRVIPARRFYLDGAEVPSDHAFDSYFDDSRLDRIMAALRFLTRPGQPEPAELAAMRKVLETPDDLRRLLPMLDSPYAGAAFCALWRVERLNCGDARHMTDQTLERVVLMLADSPKSIWPVQASSECVTLRKGQFPTDKTMTRAGAPPWARPDRWTPAR